MTRHVHMTLSVGSSLCTNRDIPKSSNAVSLTSTLETARCGRPCYGELRFGIRPLQSQVTIIRCSWRR